MSENMGDGLNIHKGHDHVRDVLKERTGHIAKKINLRNALDFSLSNTTLVEDFAEEKIEGFKEFNSREQLSILEYVLIADLLKRGFWNEQREFIKQLVVAPDFMDRPFNIKDDKQTTFKKIKGNDWLSWGETTESLHRFLIDETNKFITEWGERMRTTEPDAMYRQRFQELLSIMNEELRGFGLVKTPESVLTNGLGTGIAFPMGLLKHMPELLQAQGKKPTRENIVEAFLKSMVGVTATYAAQDLMSFDVLEGAINPRYRVGGSYPVNFSPDFFTLNSEGKLEFKPGAFEKIHSKIITEVDNSHAHDHAYKNQIMNHIEQKPQTEPGTANSPWKTCPALFGNLLMDYDQFFKPILDKVLELQEEYR